MNQRDEILERLCDSHAHEIEDCEALQQLVQEGLVYHRDGDHKDYYRLTRKGLSDNPIDRISAAFKQELVCIIGAGHDDAMIKELLSALREKEMLTLCKADEEVLTLLESDRIVFERPQITEEFMIEAPPKLDLDDMQKAFRRQRRERELDRASWVRPGKKNNKKDFRRFMNRRR